MGDFCFKGLVKLYKMDQHFEWKQIKETWKELINNADSSNSQRYSVFFWKYKNNSMSSSEDALTTIEIPAVHEFRNTK